MKPILIIINLLFFTIGCKSQTKELEYRSVEYYKDQVIELQLRALIKEKVFIDSIQIAEAYIDKETNRLNKDGLMKYIDIKKNIYLSFFKDYLYQQHLEYGDNVYVLYFTMAGFDDMQWNIFRWQKEYWKDKERLSREKVKSDCSVKKILWNYDEGPKNAENIRIFIKNDYLVMERGNLYHSLYDLKTEKVILNEESPWYTSDGKDKAEMNGWIKNNLHDKIEIILNKKRE